jgi:hypothetical protein
MDFLPDGLLVSDQLLFIAQPIQFTSYASQAGNRKIHRRDSMDTQFFIEARRLSHTGKRYGRESLLLKNFLGD